MTRIPADHAEYLPGGLKVPADGGFQLDPLELLALGSQHLRPLLVTRGGQLTDTAGRLAEVTTAHAAELAQVRADAAREREELRDAMESRARVLNESRDELRARAERAEQGWSAALAELGKARQETGPAQAPASSRRRRGSEAPE